MISLVARGMACTLLAAGLLVGGDVPARAAGCADDIGTRHAVILVHGFDSGPGTWTEGAYSMIDALQTVDGVYSRLFDYQAHNTEWVTHNAIGPALADFIACVSESSFVAGGPGKVVLVDHSMGGLAARCALDAACSGRSDVADRVDLVLTLGTPNLGSFLRGGGVSDPATALGVTLGAVCDVGNLISVGALQWWCDLNDALLTSPAGRAFTPGRRSSPRSRCSHRR